MQLRPLAFIIVFCLSSAHAFATTIVPDPLKAWVPWVMQDHEQNTCPFPYRNAKKHQCAWPDVLTLAVDQRGASFEQAWTVYQRSSVALAGNLQHWPQDVTVDGDAVVVANKRGVPYIVLQQGRHRLAGSFVWHGLPNALQLPKNTGILALTIDKKNIPFPHFEAGGRLWLNETGSKQQIAIEDHVQVEVFRRIIDDIPMRMITLLDLHVTGKAREWVMKGLLPDDAIPLSIKGALPMRLEADGKLRMQVRAGHWQVYLTSRYIAPVDHLLFTSSDHSPHHEIWVFDAKPALRLVEVKGVVSVDPRQTRLPSAWQRLPAYQMNEGDDMVFTTKRRGDPQPSANVLNLKRDLWLDFDGGGYTFHDVIAGEMRQQWRLNMSPELTLGRAVVNGVDQLITRAIGSESQGIELRQGHLSIQADGRYDGDIGSIPAVGWQDNFTTVTATLHLPAGWRLFAASGADSVAGASWLDRWRLLDIFLVLIASLAVFRLLGRGWGVIALLCFVLSWHEQGAPQFIWLLLIACTALMQVAPEGRLRKSMVVMRYLSLLALLIIAIPYAIDTVRTAIYPQLERPSVVMDYTLESVTANDDQAMATLKPNGAMMQERAETFAAKSMPSPMRERRVKKELGRSYYDHGVDPHAKVQTGPGLPTWQWSSVPIRWNGPVQQGQLLGVTLIPPLITSLLKLICVLLVMLLALRFAGVAWQNQRLMVNMVKLGIVGWLLAGTFAMPTSLHAAAFPSATMLKELQSRLLQPPKCLPQCAQISRMQLHVEGNTMRILLEVHASENVSIPVPSNIGAWMPSHIMLDGTPSQAQRGAKHALWVYVPQGKHHIQLMGAIKPVRDLQLPLPLQPRAVTIDATGWRVKGVHQDGSIEQSLQLQRITTASEQQANIPLAQTVLPSFVTVERTVHLGLQWQVNTVVTRISPLGSAIALDIPLIAGESVNTDGIRVVGEKVSIQFSAQQRRISWQSVLQPRESLSLTASKTMDWVALWRLDVSPIWHVTLEGIPQIHHQSNQGTWYPQWQPWPGESLTIHAVKPLAVQGKTKTVDHTELLIKPGQRATDVSFSMTLRSSQAEQYTVHLPPDALLRQASINGQSQPLRIEEGGILRLPISPGKQEIKLEWQSPIGISAWWHTPLVNIGLDSVNANIEVAVPASRWILFAYGPQMGPAILFWGVLIVVIIIAIGLGQTKQTPLKTYQWLLLGIGLSQTIIGVAMLVVAWLFAMGRRKDMGETMTVAAFNTMQVFLALFTVVALLGLVSAVAFGLLGHPDMQISGNGSSAALLQWYADQSSALLPEASIISVPMWLYRGLMLAWSLWLAFALLGWLQWAWQCFLQGGLWRQKKVEHDSTS